MADNYGGTSGNEGPQLDQTPPDVESIGGRFKMTTKFVPSKYGSGYWELCVTDTLLGGYTTTTVYDAASLRSAAEEQARYLLSGNASDLAGSSETRFDLPNQEETAEGPLDNAVEESTESGNGQ